ncbi:MAG TPA: hydroxymethylbilane synthase [Acidimicrobiales bacterium]|nr:hydroxymethylbilane synthase [Acidimicrobiales bacterium]
MTAPLRLATRGSRLARWQASWVAARVEGPTELVIVDTAGDRRPDVPLSSIGGQGVFVKEVQAAVLAGDADAAVHSAKDLPAETPPGLVLAAIGEREDPRDALVGARLDDIPRGGVVATGAARRRALLASRRPDLRFAELRGNIATRLDKAAGFDAIVMALAALRRLSLEERVAEALDPSWFVPQVGQGAIAVECRADDGPTRARLATVEDAPTRTAVTAERAFLATLGGGCTLPVGGYAVVGPSGGLTLHAVLAASEQGPVLRRTASGEDPAALGAAVAAALLAEAPAAG